MVAPSALRCTVGAGVVVVEEGKAAGVAEGDEVVVTEGVVGLRLPGLW